MLLGSCYFSLFLQCWVVIWECSLQLGWSFKHLSFLRLIFNFDSMPSYSDRQKKKCSWIFHACQQLLGHGCWISFIWKEKKHSNSFRISWSLPVSRYITPRVGHKLNGIKIMSHFWKYWQHDSGFCLVITLTQGFN